MQLHVLYETLYLHYLEKTYEDRVQLIDVLADPNFENNSFDLTITYEIIGRNIPAQELQFVLQSSR